MTKPTNTMSDTSNHLISHPNTQWPSNTTLRYTPKILTHVHQKKKKKLEITKRSIDASTSVYSIFLKKEILQKDLRKMKQNVLSLLKSNSIRQPTL